MKLNQAVSRRLSELLKERKMTQYQLYMKSGVPKSTIGDEIRNEKVTPSGSPALVNPINSGMDEQEQNGVTVPSRAAMQFAQIP